MTAPIFSLPVSGSNPVISTKAALDDSVNAVVQSLYDEISAAVSSLNPRGSWDASAGTFPAGSTEGDFYIVSVAGTVDGQAFAIGDWLVSLVDSASTTVFAGNWFLGAYSQVVPTEYLNSTQPGKKVKIISGVIRNTNDGNGWQIIDDAAHGNVNVSAVSTNTTAINVAYNFTAAKVISFVCGPDERMAQAGMTVGASVSVTGAGIWVGAPLTFWIDPLTNTKGVPGWFDPTTIEASGAGALRTIVHPEINTANVPPVIAQGFNSGLIGGSAATSSFTTTGFAVQSMTDLAAKVAHNGTDFVVTTGVDTSVHTITGAWEAANGGQIRVTHPECENAESLQLHSTNSDYLVIETAVTSTVFTARFFDRSTGAQIASPMSGMGLRFSRPRKCRAADFKSTRLNVTRGQARVDPTLLHDGTLPLANIWFVGVMLVD